MRASTTTMKAELSALMMIAALFLRYETKVPLRFKSWTGKATTE